MKSKVFINTEHWVIELTRQGCQIKQRIHELFVSTKDTISLIFSSTGFIKINPIPECGSVSSCALMQSPAFERTKRFFPSC